ncbi:MAG: tol-pal system protein YbgF [Deltaproteobacteria bacterium]|nr:tol-pal system protein YbgF [Deltaproteobacteria bacterium]
MSALRDENRRLTQSVSEMRQERRQQDRRMRDLQHQLDEVRAGMAGKSFDAGIPSLPVEVAAPQGAANATSATPGQRVVAVADDGTEIVYEGDAAAGKVATLDDDPPRPPPVRRVGGPPPSSSSSGGAPPLDAHAPVPSTSDRLDLQPKIAPLPGTNGPATTVRAARTSPAAKRSASEPSERSGEAASTYQAAVELVKSGKYEEGVTALRAFIRAHPRHDYADNAQYWIGEAFYARKEFQTSLTEFRNVIETFPRGNKVPDALLKVGYCYQSLGQKEKARAVLEQVVNLYPKSEPAALAAKRLELP